MRGSNVTNEGASGLTRNVCSGVRVRNSVRLDRLDFACPSNAGPILSSIDVRIGRNRVLNVLKHAKDKGSSLTSLLLEICSYRGNVVLLSKHPVASCPLTILRHSVSCIPRRGFLFSSALRRGVTFNLRSEVTSGPTVLSTMGRTTGSTYVRSGVVNFPSRCGAVIKRHKIALSKNRGRQDSVTETLLGSSTVLVLSSSLSTISASARRRVLRGLVRAERNGAAVIVTREVSALRGTSRITILSSKGLARCNAPRRLLRLNNFCTSVDRGRRLRDRLNDWDI